MRRFLLVALCAAFLACPRARRAETTKITADFAPSASASVKKDELEGPRGSIHTRETPVVYARGDDVGYVDVGGRVARTVDGGRRWTWSALPTPFTFESLSVADDGAAWATLDDDDTQATRLVHLVDGKWTDVTPKLPATPSGRRYGFVQARDAQTAFSSRCDEATPTVLTLLATHDGGATWKRSDVPTLYVRGVSFFALDADRVLAFGEIDHGMGSMPGELFSTSDGGASWSALPKPPNHGGIVMRDAKHGWLVASEMMTAPPNLWRTDDGARTWRKIFGGNDLWSLPLFDGEAATILAQPLLTTTDGGGSWLATTRTSEDETVAARGSQVWRTTGATLDHSSDGGRTWAPLKTNLHPASSVASFEAPTSRTLWMVEQLEGEEWLVVVSHDGGASWTASTPMPKE